MNMEYEYDDLQLSCSSSDFEHEEAHEDAMREAINSAVNTQPY